MSHGTYMKELWHTYEWFPCCNNRMSCCKLLTSRKTVQHTATNCNTLQHTATYCNTLQQQITCCNNTTRFRKVPPSSPQPPPTLGEGASGTKLRHTCLLQCVAVCCSLLQCVTVCYSVLQCVAVSWRLLQRAPRARNSATPACCSVLQCVAVCCSVSQCVTVCHSVSQCVTVCCSVLHCVLVCCNVLQCVTESCSVLQRVAVCCSVWQWASTHMMVWTVKISQKSGVRVETAKKLFKKYFPGMCNFIFQKYVYSLWNSPKTSRRDSMRNSQKSERYWIYYQESLQSRLLRNVYLRHTYKWVTSRV